MKNLMNRVFKKGGVNLIKGFYYLLDVRILCDDCIDFFKFYDI